MEATWRLGKKGKGYYTRENKCLKSGAERGKRVENREIREINTRNKNRNREREKKKNGGYKERMS